jgi:transposase
MKTHNNARLTPLQRRRVRELYRAGGHTQAALADMFGTTPQTIAKWARRDHDTDAPGGPRKRRQPTITPAFAEAVRAYRAGPATSHHGKVRIAHELRREHACSNPSNVYRVLRQLGMANPARPPRKRDGAHVPVGKHRTQMDIQQLPAVGGGQGFEYKITIIHLSTRTKYSEIHGDSLSPTIAGVFQRALENLPPFS